MEPKAFFLLSQWQVGGSQQYIVTVGEDGVCQFTLLNRIAGLVAAFQPAVGTVEELMAQMTVYGSSVANVGVELCSIAMELALSALACSQDSCEIHHRLPSGFELKHIDPPQDL